ncbi:MAG TPA: protein-disulfide reductase DsbD domain-containing protein [Candidatus Acidoferrales bacterium]|nr:protein-disulfide reductase DsbD domain-containing protein [Candidatus Acidoferrales bacterium]
MASNSFCKALLPLSLLITTAALAQNNGYLTIGEPAKIAGKRGAAVQTKIPVSIREGFHVNSNTPSEEYLIPLKLTWTSTGALEGGSVTYPKPLMEKFDFSDGKPISVFMGNFDLVASFKVAANAPAGPGIAAGKLRYQACSNKACYPPKTIDLSISYQVQ